MQFERLSFANLSAFYQGIRGFHLRELNPSLFLRQLHQLNSHVSYTG